MDWDNNSLEEGAMSKKNKGFLCQNGQCCFNVQSRGGRGAIDI